MTASEPDQPRAHTFDEVLHQELEAVDQLRRLRHERGEQGVGEIPPRAEATDAADRSYRSRLLGLAFSGGGIRSATFNLGIAQGLARLGLLSRLDYFSTNSGGGYLGGWLLAWMRRMGIRKVETELGGGGSEDQPEPRPVRFLRSFSNYLTPQTGAFSADTWTMVATYLRNLFLNLLILVLALGAMLLLPRLILLLSRGVGAVAEPWKVAELPFPLLLGLVFLALGIGFMARNQTRIYPQPATGPAPWWARQMGVQITVVLPLLLAGWAGGLWMWFSIKPDTFSLAGWMAERNPLLAAAGLAEEQGDVFAWMLLAALAYFGVWLLGFLGFLPTGLRHLHEPVMRRRWRLWLASVAAAVPSGAVGGFLLWALLEGLHGIEGQLRPEHFAEDWHLLHVTAFRGPLIVMIFMLTAFVHTGLLGREFPESLRQWWSRLGAWLLIYSITWIGFCGIAFYGGMALALAGSVVTLGLGVGWLGSTLGGVAAGRLARQPGDRPPLTRRLVSAIAPQIFIVGLLALLSLGLHIALSPRDTDLSEPCRDFWLEAEEGESFLPLAKRVIGCHSERLWYGTTPWGVPALLLGFTAAALLLSWRVDINEFSMHLFYRNRLIRAYLGASNENRREQSFTGFDPADDLDLAELIPAGMEPPRCEGDEGPPADATGYDGPFPLLNITLNLVKGHELAWQERKAASFVFTPLYSGYPYERNRQEEPWADSLLERAGFRPTRCYRELPPRKGVSLGTAMAISGAAASPNMGAGSTPAMAFLLTVFNVRLGWWLGNPRHRRTWDRMGPRVGFLTLLAELFGYTGEDSRFVYLSDGGHFDNSALYEMVRRRCRFIVATDVGADAELTFNDLANAIRKCQIDFGIDIELNTSKIAAGEAHCVLGRIRYDRVDPDARPGLLLYLKASLNGNEPRDVASYAAAHQPFPHESTADQWFGESQFESYRKLGQHIAMEAFRPLAGTEEDGEGKLPGVVAAMSVPDLFEALRQHWDPDFAVPAGTDEADS